MVENFSRGRGKIDIIIIGSFNDYRYFFSIAQLFGLQVIRAKRLAQAFAAQVRLSGDWPGAAVPYTTCAKHTPWEASARTRPRHMQYEAVQTKVPSAQTAELAQIKTTRS